MAASNEEKPPSVPGKDDSKPVLQDPILTSDPIETEEGVLRLPPSSLLPDHQETINTKMGLNDEGHEVDDHKSAVSKIRRLWKTEFTKPTLRILIVSHDMSLSKFMTEALGEYEVRDRQDADFVLLRQLTNFSDVVTALKKQFDIGAPVDVLLLDLDTLYKELDEMEKIRKSQDEEKMVWSIAAPESAAVDAFYAAFEYVESDWVKNPESVKSREDREVAHKYMPFSHFIVGISSYEISEDKVNKMFREEKFKMRFWGETCIVQKSLNCEKMLKILEEAISTWKQANGIIHGELERYLQKHGDGISGTET